MNQQLETHGYLVIPTDMIGGSQVDQMMNTLHTFPEFKSDTKTFVLGGYSGLGNPASFHNPFIRDLRLKVMKHMVPVFSDYVAQLPTPDVWNVEQIAHRLMYRQKGMSASKESWHRDETPNAKLSDKTFGGWWNLDDTPQYFSCVPGTHKGVRGHSGFAGIKDKNEKAQYNASKKKVEIPPGHILLFYEHIVHEVLSTKAKADQHRLFLGWRVTKENDPIHANLEQRLGDQAVMSLKSNQNPPMYSLLHWTNWRQKIVDFSTQVHPACTEDRVVMSGKDKDKTYRVVHRFMHSLKDYGFELYPPYTHEEIEVLKPNKQWTIGGEVWKL